MSVPQTAKTPTDHDDVAVMPYGRGEDDFWDVAKQVERWWMMYKRHNHMHVLLKRERLGIKIGHYDFTEAIGVTPASIWKRNTTIKVAVWSHGQPKRTGDLTYCAADSTYRFRWTKSN